MPKTTETPNSTSEQHNPPELVAFRKSIDQIDDDIIALLKKRCDIVANVGEFKQKSGAVKCFIRSGREADMVRRIYKAFTGSRFAPEAAVALWRIIIGASTAIEGKLRISVCAPSGDETLYWLAREYFGPTAIIIKQPHVNRVVGDVVDDKAEVGLLPPPHIEIHGNWWATLSDQQENCPQLFAQVPFVTAKNDAQQASGYAIAKLTPEATASDSTLITVESSAVSSHRLVSAFTTAGFTATRVHFVNSRQPGNVHHLLQVDGYITAEDERLKTIIASMQDGVHRWKVLGTYADPIRLSEAV